ncbi:Sulfotransferase 1A1 [Ophiophagus hannah]|uniref:Sulfotransferase n=1 Tax=Ophiophagus hannah TaxID=8665 RepID=V8PBE6_OPHHA|nr:Sulfotransferase 1A1 [Ophiophagus hannah]
METGQRDDVDICVLGSSDTEATWDSSADDRGGGSESYPRHNLTWVGGEVISEGTWDGSQAKAHQEAGQLHPSQEKMKPEQEEARPPLVPVKGIPMIKYFAEIYDEVESFEAHPDDLLISTYPKSGTTWVSEIIDMIYKEGSLEKCRVQPIYMRVPFLEFAVPGVPTGIELLKEVPRPCLIKTHLPVQMLPKSFLEKNCKVIYVARNAKDVAVSYYYFYQMAKVHPEPGTWEEFLEKFMDGRARHFLDSFPNYRRIGLENPEREIRKVMEFLERPVDENLVKKISHHTSFKVMSQNQMANYKSLPSSVMDHTVSPFMRKDLQFQLSGLIIVLVGNYGI